jgi:hypothetical protein
MQVSMACSGSAGSGSPLLGVVGRADGIGGTVDLDDGHDRAEAFDVVDPQIRRYSTKDGGGNLEAVRGTRPS